MPVFKVESMDHEARGVARRDGKTVFVEGALPGEQVEASIYRRHPNYERARLERVIRPSSQRVEPVCPHFGTCGGCSMHQLGFAPPGALKVRTLP
ncbi:MAG TPA: TRAM domain-containing protein, partial [Rhodocyclaceae bacterium]|nr:TRAM domain-containing protein [Rhodocyclaceae bacterium]